MKIFVTCITLVSFAVSLHAQSIQVDYSAPPGMPAVYRLSGTAVPNNNSVWIGSFDNGFDVAGNADDPNDLVDGWNFFGGTTIQPLAGQPGRFSGTTTSFDPAFSNQKIYLWIFWTDGNDDPLPNFSNVREYGLYSSTNSNWNFPSASGLPLPEEIYSGEINQFLWGSGGSGLFLSPAQIVPEPAALSLLGLALPVAILAIRKRRS